MASNRALATSRRTPRRYEFFEVVDDQDKDVVLDVAPRARQCDARDLRGVADQRPSQFAAFRWWEQGFAAGLPARYRVGQPMTQRRCRTSGIRRRPIQRLQAPRRPPSRNSTGNTPACTTTTSRYRWVRPPAGTMGLWCGLARAGEGLAPVAPERPTNTLASSRPKARRAGWGEPPRQEPYTGPPELRTRPA